MEYLVGRRICLDARHPGHLDGDRCDESAGGGVNRSRIHSDSLFHSRLADVVDNV